MLSRTITVRRPEGLHARPAALFVEAAKKHPHKVEVECQGKRGNAKSILSLLQMGISRGQSITIYAEGDGANEILESLAHLAEQEH